MRLSLQGCFDLGYSVGLGDAVFLHPQEIPDIAEVGVSNPLGEGVLVDLCQQHGPILKLWKERAIEKARHPDTESGYVRPPGISDQENESAKQHFRKELAEHIRKHRIDACRLTIYAVGVVFVRLDHAAGIPPAFLQGFHKCYEFAAYGVEISDRLLEIATETVKAGLSQPSNLLAELSRRPDAARQADSQGLQETKLFTGFTCIAFCVDPDDNVADVIQALHEVEGGDLEELVFDYHGTLHFGWAVCVLEPRIDPETKIRGGSESIERIVVDIQIAHVFLATCQAFENLFLQETRKQVDGYVKGEKGRTSAELNRLRTLALAVVTLTQYAGVAEAVEDQNYFRSWEKNALIAARHDKIQKQCELLYNVQAAETQSEEARRERTLGSVVLILTAGTLISVLVDSYEFVDYKEGWFALWVHRVLLLSVVLLLVATVLLLIFRRLRTATPGR